MRPHPLRLSSDDGVPLPTWAVLMANYNSQTHNDWQQYGWSCQHSTLRRINRVMMSGADSLYSDLHVRAKFRSRGTQYLHQKFHCETQGDRRKY